jgi:phosphate-selective porin
MSLAGETLAKQSFFYKELNLIGGYSDAEDWVGKGQGLSNSAGFEYFRKFSNEYGDYLTCDLQVRLAYDSSESRDDAWGVEIHNAWAEYKLDYGYNLKFGHFDPAFGLEPLLDTHGTLLQTMAMKNIGFKKDWGLSLRGSMQTFDYEIAVQLGSGMSIHRKDGNFLLSSRIGTPAYKDFQYGFSLLYGEVLKTKGMRTFPRNELVFDSAITKKRIGIDGQYIFGAYLFKGEFTYGEDDGKEVLGYLLEVNYTLPHHQQWQLEAQFVSWINDLNKGNSDDSTLTLGVSFKVSASVTLRANYIHDFNLATGSEDDKFLVQFYYFGL